MPNYGLCADCDKEVELMQNGCCSICQSESTMKRGAISELELAIENKRQRALNLANTVCNLSYALLDGHIDNIVDIADKFVKALEDYKNV